MLNNIERLKHAMLLPNLAHEEVLLEEAKTEVVSCSFAADVD